MPVTRRQLLIAAGTICVSKWGEAWTEVHPAIAPQPYFENVKRAIETLAAAGAPIAPHDAERISSLAQKEDVAAIETAEGILNAYTLARLLIASDSQPQIAFGAAGRELVQQGWKTFLIRVENPVGSADNVSFSTNLLGTGAGLMSRERSPFTFAQKADLADTGNKGPLIEKMWLHSELDQATQLELFWFALPTIVLSGIPVEYRVIHLFSRDAGERRHKMTLAVFPRGGKAFSRSMEFDFNCLPSRLVSLRIKDQDGVGSMASLTIKDKAGHVYPPQVMRLAPDMPFQEQIYRADGETLRLPNGEYTIVGRRGPEYLSTIKTVTIDSAHAQIEVDLTRWIDPAKWGWYSGDAHIHAAGCAHYQNPTEGVTPETMIRQVRGEGLWLGEVLTWGPSWYYQKQFFTGGAVSPQAGLEHPELQKANSSSLEPKVTPKDSESILRYDIEVSGFPSSHAGHLNLLRLKEQDYPGTKVIEDWPSWNLPILKWAKQQGAVVGYAHCGSGMFVDSTDLPNYEIPPMDGIGTQEAIVDVTHDAVDFLAGCDTQPVAEMTAWYHMLNCGYRVRLIGETDYPCITGERPGMWRTYVQLEKRPVADDGYEAWIEAMLQGRIYCGDGRSHLLEFKVNGKRSGDDVLLRSGTVVDVEALVAARLERDLPADHQARKNGPLDSWHLENARIGTSRQVPVELIVNGTAVEMVSVEADGTPRRLTFKTPIGRSSWIALRILPSSHTYPVFVQVGSKPIRASRRSAEWCRACVDKVWEEKSPFMRESERPAAAEAFAHARKTYETIAAECEMD